MNEQPKTLRDTIARIGAAFGLAILFGLGVYSLLNAIRPVSGLISFSFLMILPAAICALMSYVCDPWGQRRRRFYLMIPVWLNLAVIVISLIVLHEGVICVLILSPLWLISGVVGSSVTYAVRKRLRDRGTAYCSAMLLLPLFAMQLENAIPLAIDDATVSREITINASPAQIWPLLQGVPDVGRKEGRWNFSQDVVGIPRPLGANLVGSGIGATRIAQWGSQVAFRETIIDWVVNRRIGWSFQFDKTTLWRFSDRHLVPDSPYFKITDGAYAMRELGHGRTLVTLDTSYWIKTPVNSYSKLWGELFLGDLENNLLSMIKHRAETANQLRSSTARSKTASNISRVSRPVF